MTPQLVTVMNETDIFFKGGGIICLWVQIIYKEKRINLIIFNVEKMTERNVLYKL